MAGDFVWFFVGMVGERVVGALFDEVLEHKIVIHTNDYIYKRYSYRHNV